MKSDIPSLNKRKPNFILDLTTAVASNFLVFNYRQLNARVDILG